MEFIIALRTPGLVLADLSPRLYLNEEPIAMPASATLTDLVGGNYLASSLPDGSRSRCYTLTNTYGGVWYSKTWGGWIDYGGAPGRVIVPVRTGGLDVAALAPALYRSGAPVDVDFTTAEVGSPGDYRLAGWEVRSEGAACLLTWEPGGELSWREDVAPPVAAGPLAYDDKRKATAVTLAAKSGPVILRRPGGAYDAATQTTAPGDPTDFPLSAVLTAYDRRFVDGKNILPQDRQSLTSVSDDLQAQISAGVTPDSTWKLVVDELECGIQDVSPLQPAPGGAWIMMTLQVRSGG